MTTRTQRTAPGTPPDRPAIGVGTIVLKPGAVLLIRRATPPKAGEWSLPGGRQGLGETVEEAALREVLEETGLRVHILGLVDVVDLIERDRTGRVQWHYTLINHAATPLSGDLQAGDDAAEAAWVPFADLSDLGLWCETLRVIERARALWPDGSP